MKNIVTILGLVLIIILVTQGCHPAGSTTQPIASGDFTEQYQEIHIKTGASKVDAETAHELVLSWVQGYAKESFFEDPPLVLMLPELLQPGDRIRPYIDNRPGWEWLWESEESIALSGEGAPPEIQFPPLVEVTTPAWFFWVDWDPHTFFGHEGHFILLNHEIGDLIAYPVYWWPVINGEQVWNSDEGRFSSKDIIWPSDGISNWIQSGPQLTKIMDSAYPVSSPNISFHQPKFHLKEKSFKKYAIVIGGTDQVGAHKNSQKMEELLKNLGFEVKVINKKQNESGGINALKNSLQDIDKKITSDDVLMIYFAGHGGNGKKKKQGSMNSKFQIGSDYLDFIEST